ncbi:MAG: hypothetical protein HW416_3471 [Chloroflexi bacterium]|nr:hypothetical protein [Chloroflexota bacterium]
MAEVESISHSGMVAPDTRAVHEFYANVLCGKRQETVSRAYEGPRGGQSHPCVPRQRDLPPSDVLRGGDDSFRHGFAVSRERFDDALDWLRTNEVAFDGPVTHPERGPIGQSVYFRDAGGNFFELCWRRDENRAYHRVILADG